jgi:hypothetical protein
MGARVFTSGDVTPCVTIRKVPFDYLPLLAASDLLQREKFSNAGLLFERRVFKDLY